MYFFSFSFNISILFFSPTLTQLSLFLFQLQNDIPARLFNPHLQHQHRVLLLRLSLHSSAPQTRAAQWRPRMSLAIRCHALSLMLWKQFPRAITRVRTKKKSTTQTLLLQPHRHTQSIPASLQGITPHHFLLVPATSPNEHHQAQTRRWVQQV